MSRIAIQAADLDGSRIDGTRVYLMQLLRRFGALGPEHEWHLYHRARFNPELAPPEFPNYRIHTVAAPAYWTQTRFAWEVRRLRPDRLWMPVQALPFFLPKKIETIVTIHDLAFKYFPEHFPKKDVRRLNWFTDFAVKKADKLIAVSESTRRDILRQYPGVSEKKIRVIYHGFDTGLFAGRQAEDCHPERSRGIPNDIPVREDVLGRYSLESESYLLYVGAIQPRKNLVVLLEAFGRVKKKFPEMKLVLAGEKAWLWQETVREIEGHPFRRDIVLTGKVAFQDLSALYQGARAFVFPSLYEGFGIPILEAFASGVPVICAKNSSLTEVGGDAALYFDALDVGELASHIEAVWNDASLGRALVRKGREQMQKFSWDKCAQETLDWITA
jgi:glycosyltransferase involved in cell wall biosynthesis